MKLAGHTFAICLAALAITAAAFGQQKPYTDDLNENFKLPPADRDYTKRDVMVPMRDGVKLFTVIWIPKGAHDAPMVLTRTPYDAAHHIGAPDAAHLIDALGLAERNFVKAGYVRIYQDVRGKYGSEGPSLMTPPPLGSGYNNSGADDTTDAWDTIDWLVKNVHESNGRVGMIGSSYEGFTVVMALLHPHPALKVAAPESPMIDGWMGDDWFHYGAFRQTNIDYILGQTSRRGPGLSDPHLGDDYTNFLEKGSAGSYAQSLGMDALPYWKDVTDHPSYDGFWQSQALDKLIAKTKLTVPIMWEQGLWDQEDMYGGNHTYRAWEPQDTSNTMNFLVMGPWFHSQINRQGRAIGPFVWATDTTEQWRRDVVLPFFKQYLEPRAPKATRRLCGSMTQVPTAGILTRSGQSAARKVAAPFRSRCISRQTASCRLMLRNLAVRKMTSMSPIRRSLYPTARGPCSAKAEAGGSGCLPISASSMAAPTC